MFRNWPEEQTVHRGALEFRLLTTVPYHVSWWVKLGVNSFKRNVWTEKLLGSGLISEGHSRRTMRRCSSRRLRRRKLEGKWLENQG